MNRLPHRPIAAQLVSLSLALMVTLCTLWGIDSLAGNEGAAPQQLAAAAAARA